MRFVKSFKVSLVLIFFLFVPVEITQKRFAEQGSENENVAVFSEACLNTFLSF